jgi:hypothetical protein
MILGKPSEQQWMNAPSAAKTATARSKKAPKNKKRS